MPSNLKEGAQCGGACNLIGNCAAGLDCQIPETPALGMPLRGVAADGMMMQQIGTCVSTAPERECGGCEEVEGGADADNVSRELAIARLPMDLPSPRGWRVLW
eukprot:COSAG02_NODE_3383_length_6836_cov_11.009500_2_plen_103_part_00